VLWVHGDALLNGQAGFEGAQVEGGPAAPRWASHGAPRVAEPLFVSHSMLEYLSDREAVSASARTDPGLHRALLKGRLERGPSCTGATTVRSSILIPVRHEEGRAPRAAWNQCTALRPHGRAYVA
jgi:hypothetical protein